VKLSPQEKKRLSYMRDRRNDYRENDKASRKAIPLRKRLAARAFRRKTKEYLPKNHLEIPEEELETLDGKIFEAKRQAQSDWRKKRDVPLGEYLLRKQERRVRRAADAEADRE
jgi:hypothetical protein